MITKILFTLLVVVGAAVFIRHKERRLQRQRQAAPSVQKADSRRAMLATIGVVGVMVGLSALIYFWHWEETHRVVVVEVINSHTGERQRYHAYHTDVGARRFRTIEGRRISISDAERMEVQQETPVP